MQDSKERSWTRGESRDADLDDGSGDDDCGAAEKDVKDGWQQYRKWISKAPAPGRRRGGLDPSLYTWKGYRTWTEQVKRNWDDS